MEPAHLGRVYYAVSGLCSFAFFAQNPTENIALRARPEQVLNAFDRSQAAGQ